MSQVWCSQSPNCIVDQLYMQQAASQLLPLCAHTVAEYVTVVLVTMSFKVMITLFMKQSSSG